MKTKEGVDIKYQMETTFTVKTWFKKTLTSQQMLTLQVL